MAKLNSTAAAASCVARYRHCCTRTRGHHQDGRSWSSSHRHHSGALACSRAREPQATSVDALALGAGALHRGATATAARRTTHGRQPIASNRCVA